MKYYVNDFLNVDIKIVGSLECLLTHQDHRLHKDENIGDGNILIDDALTPFTIFNQIVFFICWNMFLFFFFLGGGGQEGQD